MYGRNIGIAPKHCASLNQNYVLQGILGGSVGGCVALRSVAGPFASSAQIVSVGCMT